MNQNTKKTTFTLPIDLVIYLQSKENQASFVACAIQKAKEEEEANLIRKAAREMSECKEIWEELKDWDITLGDGLDD